ncbi:MAG: hypothetical protein ACI8TX_003882 [Hyphomicrobiaceae bacterium]|jgi:hypothetical protein
MLGTILDFVGSYVADFLRGFEHRAREVTKPHTGLGLGDSPIASDPDKNSSRRINCFDSK